MVTWKQNKVIGIIAAVVVIAAIIIIVTRVTGRGRPTVEQRKEIQKINEMVNQEMQKDYGEPGAMR